MATSSVSITPRLRMTRHSPTHDKSFHTVTASISEAGPSRLPEFSQLVNLTLKDMDISDDNIYASDVPTEPTRQAPPQIATKIETPAAVLRALLSRLPNKDESPTRHPDQDTEHQYPSERESDYDVETASATTSVAQSSLKNIFSRALREPGDTPRKDKSHRRRSNSIGDTDIENTPHVLEAMDIKGKRRSLSDDEVDNGNKMSARPRTRFRKTPQPLTQEFLRERFGKFSNSPMKHQNTTGDENAALQEILALRLDCSQTSPPMATSTPQHSLMSFNQSRFNSNLLDKDSGMQNAFDALDSSTDNLSNRSISPIPTLQFESEPVEEDRVDTKLNDSNIHARGVSLQTSLQATPRFKNKDLSLIVPSTAKASRSNLTVYNNHALGEHTKLQPDVNHSRLTNMMNESLSPQHSITPLRPSSPMPDHRRPHTPVDAVHERERNWNKPQPVRHIHSSPHLSHRSSSSSIRPSSPMQNRSQGSESPVDAHGREKKRDSPHLIRPDSLSPHLSRNHSFSSPRPKSPMMYRPESPVDITHERERNWNAPHPRWHGNSSLHDSKESSIAPVQGDARLRTDSMTHDSSHVDGHLHTHHTPPKLTRHPPSRPLSPLPPEKSTSSLTHASSLRTDHDSRSRPPSVSSPSSPNSRQELSSVALKGSRRHPATPINVLLDLEGEDHASRGKAVSVPTPYTWHMLSSDHRPDQPTRSNGHTPGDDSEADEVRETDYSSSIDTPKSRPIAPPEMSGKQHQVSDLLMVSKDPNMPSTPTTHKNPSPHAVQAASPSTPPHGITPKNVKLEFKTPSPPKTLPDLPTPSSSDESIDGSLMKMAKIPKLGTAHQNKWLQTPKPPGGWLATPQPAKFAEDILDEPETPVQNVGGDHILETPVTSDASRFVTKTPKPPGSWSTPAPSSLKSGESSYPEDNGQRSQLLTPVNSLSRATLNSKTPGVPGSWINTPATRKSVLKVRFDSQSPKVKEEYAQDSASESRGDSTPSDLDNPSQAAASLPSPRSPRRPKANIRVLDAFGRAETPSSPKEDSNTSRNGIRVLDAMGRDLKEEQDKEENTTPLTRDVLLSRLRQGLNELVEDIDVVDEKEDIFASDRSRIEELVATSRQARGAREKLSSQSNKAVVQPPVVKPSYVSFSWKMWIGLILAQSLLFCLMYWISFVQARKFFLNAYYDPFNPELHLFNSDNPIYLPRLDPSLVWPRRDGGTWSTWLESIDIAAYFSTLLPMDVMQSNAWTPT